MGFRHAQTKPNQILNSDWLKTGVSADKFLFPDTLYRQISATIYYKLMILKHVIPLSFIKKKINHKFYTIWKQRIDIW